jgi:hypothetical protein
MARFAIPGGWTVQAFQFALDCTPQQAARVRRQLGGRRSTAANAEAAPLPENPAA